MNIYVGNLSYKFGEVESVKILTDKFSGQSKGFGFVEMSAKAEAQSAIESLNGKDLKGRSLNVNEARPRSEGHRGGARSGGPRRGGGRRGVG
jgi:RNA recognition motif-containing protein